MSQLSLSVIPETPFYALLFFQKKEIEKKCTYVQISKENLGKKIFTKCFFVPWSCLLFCHFRHCRQFCYFVIFDIVANFLNPALAGLSI
jgi:hypothetical protein